MGKRVGEAARRAGEPTWRMPVSDDYKKRIESAIADFKNYGGRPDATAAALLLSKFAADHLGTPGHRGTGCTTKRSRTRPRERPARRCTRVELACS